MSKLEMSKSEMDRLKRRVRWAGFRHGLRRGLLEYFGLSDETERRIWIVYWAGAATAVAVMMLFRNWHGLEGYIEKFRENWISEWYTTPFALVMLGVAVLVVIVALRNKWSMGEDQEGAGRGRGSGHGKTV